MSNRTRKVALIAQLLDVFVRDDSSSSSGSSSDSDEDVSNDLLVLYNVLVLGSERKEPEEIPKLKGFVERVVPGYTNQTFKEHFRMFPDTFEAVLSVIGPGLVAVDHQGGRPSIEPHKQLLLALWFMATPDSYRSVSTQFGVARSTAFRIVRRVCYALYCSAKLFIRWPKTADEINNVTEKFKSAKGFPGVIGAVDGCHIKIRAPQEDPLSYYNRKKILFNYSTGKDAWRDGKSMFTHCYAGPAGSVHDARVFRNSPLAGFLASPNEYFRNNTHLIGDAAYPLSTHVLTPFKDNGHLTQRQNNYNYRMSATRMAIERAFGFMKTRFRILLDCLPLTDLRKIPEFIIACCVLHNICMSQDDFFPFDEEEGRDEQDDFERAADPERAANHEGGVEKRLKIMNELPFR